jgi:hypothetical protein
MVVWLKGLWLRVSFRAGVFYMKAKLSPPRLGLHSFARELRILHSRACARLCRRLIAQLDDFRIGGGVRLGC